MTLPVRYSPSGSPIANADGAVLLFGPGARLRLTETNALMGGSLAVPAVADTIATGGFGSPGTTIVMTLQNPKAKLQYRAKLRLDVQNTNSAAAAEVVLYLDASVDGGATYTNFSKVSHLLNNPNAAGGTAGSEPMEVSLPLILGSSLGVNDAVPTASLKLRARASLPVGTGVLVNSPASSGGGTPVTGLGGSIHMELEECF
jgi:hypothetical protein